jgi:hypothetical protein
LKWKQKKPSDIWQPQPKQLQLLELAGLHNALHGGAVEPALCNLIGYGGAAGGGKTEGMVGLALVALSQVKSVKIGYFRRTYKELEGADGPIERSQILFPEIGGKYNKQEHTWRFGEEESKERNEDWNEGIASALQFCHCQHESSVFAYQSKAFDILLFDEATHFSWAIVRYLMTRNRKSRHSELPMPFTVMCTNPGNIGHIWYMKLFDIRGRLNEKSSGDQVLS